MSNRRSSSHPKEIFKRWNRGRHTQTVNRGPVGTEATALKNLKKNSESFDYPKDGFVERIEYTLLYSMLREPDVYPEAVVKEHIDSEDFEKYLVVKSKHGGGMAATRCGGEELISYTQLSALLALSAEKFPATSSSPNLSNAGKSISQQLAKAVLNTVIRYAEEHGLDREREMKELLEPVEKHAEKRKEEVSSKQLMPYYIGCAATVVTGNPLPMILGASAIGVGSEKYEKEAKNLSSIAFETGRRTDVEKTGLLDEHDHDDG
uniref:Uncharacterized protein n=1 Tax=Corethron hystrix TaxID=216773 RepID=A0A6U5DRM5_9STRA|mmetsp:Transcript_13636/g.30084  ORF Transcript_13636/g.30084 Transcript_13636/m.30084 type:complete len:263 (+) Transcript_13636:117-905(+)